MNSDLGSAGARRWSFYGNCRGILPGDPALVNMSMEKHRLSKDDTAECKQVAMVVPLHVTIKSITLLIHMNTF